MGMQSDSAFVDHSLSTSYTAKKALAESSKLSLQHLPREEESIPMMWAAALIHMNICNSFSCNCPSFDQSRCPPKDKRGTEEGTHLSWGPEPKTSS